VRVLAIFLCFILFSCDFTFGNSEKTYSGDDTWQTAAPLHLIYQNYFPIGNIISPNDLSNTTRMNLLKRHFNALTAENHMKPESIAPTSRPAGSTWNYRFANADTIVNAAIAAGMEMHGHTLVWHSQTPRWLTGNGQIDLGRDETLANMEKYVTDVATHFKDRLTTWDVANEVFRDGLSNVTSSTDWKTCLRYDDNPWNRIIGPEYIEIAFLKAREADPAVKLYYNDYNLNNANKAQAVFNMVRDINNRFPNVGGRPLIDGIGMQSHHHIRTSSDSVETSIVLFASLGVEIAITELDIQAVGTFGNPPTTYAWNDDTAQIQARLYAALFKIFKRHSSVITRVTFWGLDDTTSWRNSSRPTLLNGNLTLKPAFYAVSEP